MRIWQIFVPSLLGLALAGCRSDPEIAYLQRDNLNKQRKIERLQNRIDDLEEALNTQPGPTRGMPPGEIPPAARTIDGGRTGPAATYPAAPPFSAPARTYSEPDAPGSGIPPVHVELGEPMKSGSDSSGGSSQWGPAGGQPPPMGTWRPGESALSDNSPVAQITLHPALTGGIGTGGRPGDEGILVVVEPRDFGGNIINLPGNLSVALLDPALTGEQARLGRWDFTVAETQGMIRTGSQPGIHLRLPWTSPPAHDRLKVFVRYTTRDGRKLQAERLIGVALNGPSPTQHEDLTDAESAQTASRPPRPQWSPMR